jgi:aryl-alcohol dehydrogenase-like predicted oxidoreductase
MHNIIEWGKAFYWGTSQWMQMRSSPRDQHCREASFTQASNGTTVNTIFLSANDSKNSMRACSRIMAMVPQHLAHWLSGMLTGKYLNGIPEDSRAALKGYDWLHESVTDKEKLARVDALQSIADELGCTLSQLSLGWVLKNPNVSTVITGASRVEQVQTKI